jgi:hypothetical protein
MIEICSCIKYFICDNKFNVSTSNLDDDLNIVFDDKEESIAFYQYSKKSLKSIPFKEYYEESLNCNSLREYYENIEHLINYTCCGDIGCNYIVLFPKFIFTYSNCSKERIYHSSPCIFLLYDNLDYTECVDQIDKYLDTIIYRTEDEPPIKLSEYKLDLKYIKAENFEKYCEECLNVITEIKYWNIYMLSIMKHLQKLEENDMYPNIKFSD